MKTLIRGVAVTSGAVALAAMTVTGCDVQFHAGARQDTRTYDIPGTFPGLRVRGDHGRLEVVGTDRPGVRVREDRRWSSDRGKPRTERTVANGTLTLTSKCGGPVIGYDSCGVSYRIEVPRDTEIDAHTDSGMLTASGLTGDSVRLSADSGAIRATGVRTRSLSVHNDSGAIRVDGQADSADLRNGSGLIETGGLRAAKVVVRGDSGLVRLTLASAPGSVDVVNDTGQVKLGLPGDQGYAFALSSGSGRARIAPQIRQDPASRRQIKVRTDSGGIAVSAGPA